MSSQPADETAKPEQDLTIRAYLFAGSAGLLLLWMGLSQKYGTLALLPVLMGAIGLGSFLLPARFSWLQPGRMQMAGRSLPILVLLVVIVFYVLFGISWMGETSLFDGTDLLIAAGVITYVAAQYRLFGLGTNVVPTDTRFRLDRQGGDPPEARPVHEVTRAEWIGMGVALPAAVIAAQLLWWWIVAAMEWPGQTCEFPTRRFGIPETPWRLFSLIWLLGVGTLLLRGGAGLLWAYRLRRDEARMFQQDVLWTETRGEQRRISRWLAWLRRKQARKSGRLA